MKEKMFFKLLANNLRVIRKSEGLTLKNVSDGSGLSKPFISEIERGITVPSIKSLRKILLALDFPIGEFFNKLSKSVVILEYKIY